MSEFFTDDSTEVERVMLWEDITEAFQNNPNTFGAQLLFTSLSDIWEAPTRLVLAEARHEEDDSLEIWAELAAGKLISKATLLYIDPSGREAFSYELTPQDIKQYSPEPTPLDRNDFKEMRRDIKQATWSKVDSEDCAGNKLFFS
jgi:hypothetical protein